MFLTYKKLKDAYLQSYIWIGDGEVVSRDCFCFIYG
jgi:hypothetical protein